MSGIVDVGEAIELTFHATTGSTVVASWLDPDQNTVIDSVSVPESPPSSGAFPKIFTPSVAGIWTALFETPGQPERYYIRAVTLTGPLPFAVVGDIAAQWDGTLSVAKEALAGHLVRAGSALLRHHVPDLDANLVAGKVSREVAALTVTNMVLRVMRNPRGLRAETTGPFSRTYDTSVAAGLLVVTEEDVKAVTPVPDPVTLPDGLAGIGVGTIRVLPGMAPPAIPGGGHAYRY